MSNYFDESAYFTKVFSNDMAQIDANERTKENAITDGRLKEAYKQAADIRKFEIELFWKRGTYYWAFILAAFTAHFALLGMIFSTFSKEVNKELSLKNMCELPGLSLFALAVTAFFCFFFSLAWALVNKGSKFWQKNWEAHIDTLEENVTGNLYKTFLNTNFKGDEKEFNKNPLSCKAYDYSVTKITTLTSIVLTIISVCLFLFYVILLFLKCRNPHLIKLLMVVCGIVPIVLLITSTLSIIIIMKRGKSSNFTKDKDTTNRWYQRPNLTQNQNDTQHKNAMERNP